MFNITSKNTYPDFPAIAKHLGVAVISLSQYETWADIFFVKIAGVGWRFVSKKLFTRGKVRARKIIKEATEKVQRKGEELYRVIRMIDNGGNYYGARVESALIQAIGIPGDKPGWVSVFKTHEIKRDDVLYLEDKTGMYLKAKCSYAQAMGLY